MHNFVILGVFICLICDNCQTAFRTLLLDPRPYTCINVVKFQLQSLPIGVHTGLGKHVGAAKLHRPELKQVLEAVELRINPSSQVYVAKLSNTVPPRVVTEPLAGSDNLPQSTKQNV